MIDILKISNITTQTETKIMLQMFTYCALGKQNINGVVINLCSLNFAFKMVKMNIYKFLVLLVHTYIFIYLIL